MLQSQMLRFLAKSVQPMLLDIIFALMQKSDMVKFIFSPFLSSLWVKVTASVEQSYSYYSGNDGTDKDPQVLYATMHFYIFEVSLAIIFSYFLQVCYVFGNLNQVI